MNSKDLERKATEIRIETLKMLKNSKTAFVSSCMSCVEILVTLYFAELNRNPILKVNPQKSQWPERDFFVMAKMNALATLYAILADKGFFPSSELNSYGKLGSNLQFCADLKLPGIDVPIMNENHGLSLAMGLAQVLKMERKSNKVYCLIGDEQLQNGTFWEAAMMCAHAKLDNLFLIVDRSRYQSDGSITQILEIDPIFEKFEYFGWRALRVVDGHNFDSLLDNLSKAFSTSRKPTVLICRTVLGKGIPFAENKDYYYGVSLSLEEFNEILGLFEKKL